MTPLQNESNNVLNALDEGAVTAAISLYDSKVIPNGGDPKARRSELRSIITNPNFGVKLTAEDADYWLDWFGVQPTRQEQGRAQDGDV